VKSKFIDHKGKQIFFSDYSNFNMDEMAFQTEVDAATYTVARESESSVRLLVDVRDTIGSQEIINILAESARRCKPNIVATAVVGINGIRKVFMSSIMRASGLLIMPMDSMDEAKEWLVNQ